MSRKQTPEQREQKRLAALQAAEDEAIKLREILRLKRECGETYEAAMKAVGLVLPHATLHRRLEQLRESGAEGLVDHRHPPPARFTAEIRGFVLGASFSGAAREPRELQRLVAEQFGERFSVRTLQQALRDAGISRPPVRFTSQRQPGTLRAAAEARSARVEELPAGGLAWVTAGDTITGYTRELVEAIQQMVAELPRPTPVSEEERSLRDQKGRFLPEYNAPRPRRDPKIGAVFESVEHKRLSKDLGRLATLCSKPEILQSKLRALMALPVVTERGRFDGAKGVRGTWLASLGGLDYMPETLAKFARELKWAGVSQLFAERHAQLWYEQTRQWAGDEASTAVLYVDSTTKPLWTEHFHKSGKVASLGRVMPCVESILIHQGAGVPLLVSTFSGHTPLVKGVLPLIGELEASIGEGMLGRLTVMDGEMDCVALFKEFDAQDRLFITPLSSSRVRDLGDIEGLPHLVAYRNGDWIGGGHVLLKDSKAPQSLPYRCRVVVLQRRTKETFTCFATNAPADEFADDFLLDTYFARWPLQEGVFRQLNMATAFKTVHGYGKQRVVNISVIDEMTRLEAQLARLQTRRSRASEVATEAAGELHKAEVEQRRLERAIGNAKHAQRLLANAGRAQSLAAGRQRDRQATAERDLVVQKLRVQLARQDHQEKASKRTELDRQLSEKNTDRANLEARREIYQTDTELDQIFSVLKLGYAMVLRYVLLHFFGGLRADLGRLVSQILLIPATRIRTSTTETLRFHGHRRDPEAMRLLRSACERFNALGQSQNGRVMHFELDWTDPNESHAASGSGP